jgi:hypothetical protein
MLIPTLTYSSETTTWGKKTYKEAKAIYTNNRNENS